MATLTEDEAATLQLGVDESYELSVSAGGECSVQAATVWGALHAMESFTQLLSRQGGEVALDYLPVSLQDSPRYSHRGLLIDSSRHFLPVSEILAVIDTLPMSKFNVLHWHIVDAQSFPMDPPSAPRLVQGAYSPAASYSATDIQGVVQYGSDRGVRVLLEIDVPGHAASWTKGYPDVMADCFAKYSYNINDFALNPTKEETYSLLQGVLQDAAEATRVAGRGGLLHIGGDEVVYGCWNNDSSIVAYMEQHAMSTDQLLMMFAERADEMLRALKVTPVHWEEGEWAAHHTHITHTSHTCRITIVPNICNEFVVYFIISRHSVQGGREVRLPARPPGRRHLRGVDQQGADPQHRAGGLPRHRRAL